MGTAGRSRPKSEGAERAWRRVDGELFKMTEQMNAQGPIVGWQEVLTTMRDNGIAGIEVDGDDYRIIPAEAALPSR